MEGGLLTLLLPSGGFWGTALRAACAVDALEVVNSLLDHGADLNLRGKLNA